MDIIEEVKKFVEEESNKPTSKYGSEPFTYHFTQVAKYSGQLADKLGADKEVVLISAWLHDIGSVIKGREDHHITGAEIAGEKLIRFEQETIQRRFRCLTRQGSR